MQATFLIGPAGTGKTFRCLAEVRAALHASAEGLPVLFLAPKQATYQLERELLRDPDVQGYTRLQILSFERLARFALSQSAGGGVEVLSDEGRVMVLRALLGEHQRELRIFHGAARLPGFAHQLSASLNELQRYRVSPQRLLEAAALLPDNAALADKLRDLAFMMDAYLGWLHRHHLHDPCSLLDLGADAIATLVDGGDFRCETLWLDGFAELTPQELSLLLAVLKGCARATLAFCADSSPQNEHDWLSPWVIAARTALDCITAVRALPGCHVAIETLGRDSSPGRFAATPVLAHLEKSWATPEPFRSADISANLQLWACLNADAEATVAAHEILRHVRGGGRFCEVGVLLRSLAGYHDVIARVFSHYDIPFFIDRREPAGHHPLPELTRSALRIAAFDWQLEDWFAALKTGLVCADDAKIDALEVEARARGWSGKLWRQPLSEAGLEAHEQLRQALVPPFAQLAHALLSDPRGPSGEQLAEALRALWNDLGVSRTLEDWSAQTDEQSAAIHRTVWEQMEAWVEELGLAFGQQRRSLREWLGIVESGLSNFTVGVVPPALDQVLVGAIDRSRNPNLELAIVMGLNEAVFPALPARPALLTEADRNTLEGKSFSLGFNHYCSIGHERYFAYVALTRARRRLVLTWSAYDRTDAKLNPSCFVAHISRLFPQIEIKDWRPPASWLDAEHVIEVTPGLLDTAARNALGDALDFPVLGALQEKLQRFPALSSSERLSSPAAARLYGRELRTSITSLERFAACPFKFFVHSGLRAQEQKLFEVDQRKVGDFQHQVLKAFHEEILAEGKTWREISPAQARARVRRLAERHAATFHHGLFIASPRQRFAVQQLTRALEDFVEVIVGWMVQYAFDPVAVELRFEDGGPVPGWPLQLDDHHGLLLTGSIDRVDLLPRGDGTSLCVVIDYKSSSRNIDPLLVANGIQLQLPAYLSMLGNFAAPQKSFGVERLVPAGIFYVSLRGEYKRGPHRAAVLAATDEARRMAYRHSGYFDANSLQHLDKRPRPDGESFQGDQFKYQITRSGNLHGASRDALSAAEFAALLDNVKEQLRDMGRRIFAGDASVDPYRRGAVTPCDHCDYHPICRIDPWAHGYRPLKPAP